MRVKPVAYTALGLVSVLVLGATGYAWTQVGRLTSGLVTADVIEPSAQVPASPDTPVPEQNILLVGVDARTDTQGNPLPQNVLDQLHAGDSSDGGDTTDTMIILHIPEGGGAATAISIPRDSYVDLADGSGKHKINSAYGHGKRTELDKLAAQGVTGAAAERRADQEGARTTIKTVEKFTGLTINHYAAVNLLGFSTLSEAVGGVPVCLNNPVHDVYSGANFPAGEQVLSGTRALAFVRQRHGLTSDLDRIARQQAFLAGAAKVVLGAGTLTNPVKLDALISAVQQSVLIDSGWDILTFAEQMRGLSSDGLKFETIPVESLSLQTPYDGDAVKVDPGQVQSFIRQALGKEVQTSSPGGQEAPQAFSSSSARPPVQRVTSESVAPAARSDSLSGCVN